MVRGQDLSLDWKVRFLISQVMVLLVGFGFFLRENLVRLLVRSLDLFFEGLEGSFPRFLGVSMFMTKRSNCDFCTTCSNTREDAKLECQTSICYMDTNKPRVPNSASKPHSSKPHLDGSPVLSLLHFRLKVM